MKTTFSEKQIIQFIKDIYPNANNVYNMAEGDTSQTYCFNNDGQKLVFQTSTDLQGYKKEEYIYKNFTSLNVRKVVKIDRITQNIYYCITEYIHAKRLQDLNKNDMTEKVSSIMEAFKILESVEIPANSGFGCFNYMGIAFYKSWKEYINAVYTQYQWKIINIKTKILVCHLIDEIKKYNHIPGNKRSLIHGDFGSSNVLSGGNKIYLIDWSLSLYGDPLYEIANVLFWNEKCLAPLISEIHKRYFNDDKTILTLYVYILRIGLEEIFTVNKQGQTVVNTGWAENRLEEILETFIKSTISL
jgi:hygromycin-B 4-O-kinase